MAMLCAHSHKHIHTTALMYINILSCILFLILEIFNIVKTDFQHLCLKFITESAFCNAKPAHFKSIAEENYEIRQFLQCIENSLILISCCVMC